MRPRINVVRVAVERGAVGFVGLVQFALLKINVAQLKPVVRFVQVMDLRLEFLDAFAVLRAGQFKTACRRGLVAINKKIIKRGVEQGKITMNASHIHSLRRMASTHIQIWNTKKSRPRIRPIQPPPSNRFSTRELTICRQT